MAPTIGNQVKDLRILHGDPNLDKVTVWQVKPGKDNSEELDYYILHSPKRDLCGKQTESFFKWGRCVENQTVVATRKGEKRDETIIEQIWSGKGMYEDLGEAPGVNIIFKGKKVPLKEIAYPTSLSAEIFATPEEMPQPKKKEVKPPPKNKTEEQLNDEKVNEFLTRLDYLVESGDPVLFNGRLIENLRFLEEQFPFPEFSMADRNARQFSREVRHNLRLSLEEDHRLEGIQGIIKAYQEVIEKELPDSRLQAIAYFVLSYQIDDLAKNLEELNQISVDVDAENEYSKPSTKTKEFIASLRQYAQGLRKQNQTELYQMAASYLKLKLVKPSNKDLINAYDKKMLKKLAAEDYVLMSLAVDNLVLVVDENLGLNNRQIDQLLDKVNEHRANLGILFAEEIIWADGGLTDHNLHFDLTFGNKTFHYAEEYSAEEE